MERRKQKRETCITSKRAERWDTGRKGKGRDKMTEKGQTERENRADTCKYTPSPSRGAKLLRAALRSKMLSPPCYDRITWTSDAEGPFKGFRPSFTSSALIKEVLGE